MRAPNPRSTSSRDAKQTYKRRISVVVPIVGTVDNDLQYLAGPGTEIRVEQICNGPTSIESAYAAAIAVPEVIKKAREAETNGADAVVISCMDDPGLAAARECLKIPVLGPSQTTMHLASMLGHRFSIVTTLESSVPGFENLANLYGIGNLLASVRWVPIPVVNLNDDPDETVRALVEQSVAAVKHDGAHVIVLGCTAMSGLDKAVVKGLNEAGYQGIPVIDPLPTTIRMAEAIVDLGLTQSKRTYPMAQFEIY